jgi:MSHA biogenesis protein MshN
MALGCGGHRAAGGRRINLGLEQMSLINKMLQDLDARGSQAGQGMPLDIKSVAREERRASFPVIAGVAALAALIGVGAVFGWRYLNRPAPVLKAAAPPALEVVKTPIPVAAAVEAKPVAPAPVPVQAKPVVAKVKPAIKKKVVQKRVEQRKVAKAKVKPTPKLVRAKVPPPVEGRDNSPPPRAEGLYRRALAALADGRVTEATAALEQTLQIDPRHEAARQTLVGLLIEAKRKDEAVRLLQAGLALDARQPSMAMLLARLQIESGGPAIDTLMRTLPYAAGSGEYHAFLAGALQREQRHREASEQYLAALRIAPQNGVWWMGLGISQQAEKHNAEALAAFERARDAGNLTPQLQAFVERKLQLLGK